MGSVLFEKLSSNPQVLERLSGDAGLVEKLRAGEMTDICVLTLGLEAVETWACEQLGANELMRWLVGVRRAVTAVMRAAPALVSTTSAASLQIVYEARISSAGIADAACVTAGELLQAASAVAAAGLDRTVVRPGIGIALGRGFLGMSEIRGEGEIVVVGRPVALSRRLAEERERLGAQILLDDAAGRAATRVRPLDVYRLSGAVALQRLFTPTDELTAAASFSDDYQQGLELLYVDRAAGAAAGAFNRCLEVSPRDSAALTMLERCREGSGPPRPRAIRVRV